MTIATLEQDFEAKRETAATLFAKYTQVAQAEERPLTAEEHAEIKAAAAAGREALLKLEQGNGDRALLAELERVTGLTAPARTPAGLIVPGRGLARQSLGERFIRSDAYGFIKRGGHHESKVWSTPSVEFEMFGETITEDPASGGKLIVPQYQPGVLPLGIYPPTVAALFAPGTTTSNLITYMRETVFTNAAAAVLEGAAKPESTLRFDAASDPVRKLAHWIPVSEEMLEDVAQIRSYIDSRLTYGLRLEEDDQVLNGDGIAPNILGLKNRAGLAAPMAKAASETNADVLYRQAMAIFYTSLLMPDGFILNPADWVQTVLMKTSTGEYLGGGPFGGGTVSMTLWGFPAAVTPMQPAGSGWVGAFKTGAQVFRHGGIRIDATNSHADFFIKNLVAIRAEERLAMAVYRPGSFGTVTGLTGAPVLLGGESARGGQEQERPGAGR